MRLMSRLMRMLLIRILSGPLLRLLVGLAVKAFCGRAMSVPSYVGGHTCRFRLRYGEHRDLPFLGMRNATSFDSQIEMMRLACTVTSHLELGSASSGPEPM